MGASFGEQGICSKVQQGPRERLAAQDEKAQKEEAEKLQLDRKERKSQREEAVVKAALEALRKNNHQMQRRESRAPVPEVASLNARATVVFTGRMSDTMEVPFQEKASAMKGLQCLEELVDVHLAGVRCVSGQVPTFLRPNQDDYFYMQTSDSYRALGIFDGHGIDGHGAAAVARDVLLRRLLQELPAERAKSDAAYSGGLQGILVSAFEEAHQEIVTRPEIDATLSGTTAFILVHDSKRHWLTSAWTGNCRCVMAAEKEVLTAANEEFGDASFVHRKPIKSKKKVEVVPLTKDHTVQRSDERSRIMSAGAQMRAVTDGPHLICAPGNLVGHQYGVIHVPEVVDRCLEDGTTPHFAVAATDGLWGVFKEPEVLAILRETIEENMIYGIDLLVERARGRWEQRQKSNVVDDITVGVVRF
uniref:PPM-type phosphatase domain-containing protein n=1 Tax=Alexandrium monilatum TaxID=311494 RepID=A0A6T0VD86_9DINO